MDDYKFRHLVRVYLCGGFHSDWHEKVIDGIQEDGFDTFFRFYNPKNKALVRPQEYWPWDLQAIRKSDIVFTCFEKWMEKRHGAGAIAEFGYGVGQGKLVILVNEIEHRYFTQLQYWPGIVYFNKLEEGITYLKQCWSLR